MAFAHLTTQPSTTIRTGASLRNLDLHPALLSLLSWQQQHELDKLFPSHHKTPVGQYIPINYEFKQPTIELRLQEMFGVSEHPRVGQKHLPLRITLLSPANRPVQVTMDLPGFWSNSYADVRRDMRGKYPKHHWPEDPYSIPPRCIPNPAGIALNDCPDVTGHHST